jgi:hypothetical protein
MERIPFLVWLAAVAKFPLIPGIKHYMMYLCNRIDILTIIKYSFGLETKQVEKGFAMLRL